MKINQYILQQDLDVDLTQGYVKEQKHPTEPLAILNYTAKCQYEGAWSQSSKACRGLIYNTETGEIVTRPFPKFFNHNEERAALSHGPVRVQDKMDGSLGILYQTPAGEYAIATRGSFTSEQAIHGTGVLRKRMAETGWQPYAGFTYLFEIIYPENRIVVDYGDMDDLVLLDVINNETGLSAMGAFAEIDDIPFPATGWNGFETFEQFLTAQKGWGEDENAEGFVIYFKKTGERVKFKYEEYKRLHRILTGVSSKTIWELLSTNQPLDNILDLVPDEFYDWVKATAIGLESDYARIAATTWRAFQNTYRYVITQVAASEEWEKDRRKEFALAIKDSEFKDIMFGYYDDKDIAPMIWKRLKPTFSKPFWNVDEDAA